MFLVSSPQESPAGPAGAQLSGDRPRLRYRPEEHEPLPSPRRIHPGICRDPSSGDRVWAPVLGLQTNRVKCQQRTYPL